jgi:Flp pilus assembly protein TadG
MDMMVISTFRNRLFSLLRETSGNFGMMTALLLPVSIGVVGLGLDATTMLQNKRTLQNAVDAAALATATAMTKDTMSTTDADAMAKSFVLSQMANVLSDATTASANLTTTAQISTPTPSSGSGKIYDVGLTSSYTMQTNALSQAFGWKTVTISAYGKAEAAKQNEQNGLSLYLVLDRSGSMSFITDQIDRSRYYCPNYTSENWGYYPYLQPSYPCYINKIASLKTAVGTMSDTLTKADPTASSYTVPKSRLVRVGAVAFNADTFPEQAPTWGTQAALGYVNSIPPYPTGGTDASDALSLAYEALRTKNTTEKDAHMRAGVPNFDRYIVFMTDGEMTGDSAEWNPSFDNKARVMCKAIKRDGIHLFTVAFMAPPRGKALLQACASDDTSYYEPNTMAGLVSAFQDIAQKASKSTTRLTN